MLGNTDNSNERFSSHERYLIATGPRCVSIIGAILSGHKALDVLAFFNQSDVKVSESIPGVGYI